MAVAVTRLPRWSAVHQGASQPTGTTATRPTSTPRPCLRTGASASTTRWPTPRPCLRTGASASLTRWPTPGSRVKTSRLPATARRRLRHRRDRRRHLRRAVRGVHRPAVREPPGCRRLGPGVDATPIPPALCAQPARHHPTRRCWCALRRSVPRPGRCPCHWNGPICAVSTSTTFAVCTAGSWRTCTPGPVSSAP